MPSTAAQELQNKIEAFLNKVDPSHDDPSSAQAPPADDRSSAAAATKKTSAKAKLRAIKAEMGLSTTAAPAQDNPKKGGRSWTENDYRLRGLPTPEERAKGPKRVRLNTFVLESTRTAIHNLALELGVTVGEALDELLSDGTK